MSIMYCVKVFGQVAPDGNNTYYSAPEMNAALAKAEKFFVQAKTSAVTGVNPTISITQETSCDGVNWYTGNPNFVTAQPIATGTVLFGSDPGITSIRATYLRFGVKLNVAVSAAYVEVWVAGRGES